MTDVILIVHVIIAISLIGVVLLQRSEGGGLGIGGGGGGGGMSGFMTGRGTTTMLTKITVGLAAAFMVTSITLTMLAGGRSAPRSIIENLPATAPATQAPAEEPSGPVVPVE